MYCDDRATIMVAHPVVQRHAAHESSLAGKQAGRQAGRQAGYGVNKKGVTATPAKMHGTAAAVAVTTGRKRGLTSYRGRVTR
jgi:hypothetical protein